MSVDMWLDMWLDTDVPATTNHNTGAAGEGQVAMTASDSHAIAYGQAKGWSAAKTLSALGHPGYGQKFAAQAIATMVATGCTAHQAVYGR